MLGRYALRIASSVASSSGAAAESNILRVSRRCFVKVGDQVPITFIKGEEPPVIKEDSAYPAWVFQLADKGLTKAQLLAKMGPDGEHVDEMTMEEKRRLKRMLATETIRTKNAASKKNSGA